MAPVRISNRVLRFRSQTIGGVALGTVLLCMVVLVLILFTAVSAGLSHLNLVTASTRQEHARNLVDAALAKAMSELVASDFEFGKTSASRVEVTVDGLPGATGVVTFDRSESGFASAYSTYNLDQDSAQIGARGHQVPARSVHLVARGKVGDTERWMECVYYKPPFPDGLAATGPVTVKSVYLAGIRQGQAYAGGDPRALSPEETFPANLFSNASGAGGRPAVLVGPNSRITGSAGSVGAVQVDPKAVIEGEVLPSSEPRPIPEVDIRARIDALKPNAVPVVATVGGDVDLDPSSFAKSETDLSVSGNLNLNGSALVVEGDLTVQGAILGTGVILVDGNVRILDGQSDVRSNDQVAIACRGDFELRADAPDGNYFQGLIYSEGNPKAKDITVVGATVAHGKNGAAGSVDLDNVRFLYSPGGVKLELSRTEGYTLYGHVWAWSLTLRSDPAGDPGMYLADVRAYFNDMRGNNGEGKNHKNLDEPLVWTTWLDPKHPSQRYSLWDNLSGVTTFSRPKDGTTKSQGTKYPTGLPIKLNAAGEVVWEESEALHKALRAFFWDQAMVDDKPGSGEHTHHLIAMNEIFDKRIKRTFAKSNYSLTFNLNSLLAELSGSSRVLLWRPFQ